LSLLVMVVLVAMCALTYQSLGSMVSLLINPLPAAMAVATAIAQTTLVSDMLG
jgi:hypothetical protein